MRKRIVGETPLFLIWSLSQTCGLKEEYEFDDLLMLERKLRPLQCVAEASYENRVIGDVCIDRDRTESFEPIDKVKGFSIEEITGAYGGTEFLASCCGNCPANVCGAGSSANAHRYAGCYGYLQSQYDSIDLFSTWSNLIRTNDYFAQFQFPTKDPIYSLWLERSLSVDARKCFQKLTESTQLQNLQDQTDSGNSDASSTDYEYADFNLAANEINHFKNALAASLELDIEIRVQVIPAGIVDNRNWRVPQHCSSCAANAEQWTGRCGNCDSIRPPNSPLKRFVRGDRPYWPLVRFLGIDGTNELIRKYKSK